MSNKTNTGNFFEDFEIGQTIEHAIPRTLTEGDNALYIALTGDRHPIFCNAEIARALGFRRELINDLLVFHTVYGRSVHDISFNAVINLGFAKLQLPAPVYPGDTIHAITRIMGLEENENRQFGTVYVRTQGFNQHGETVLQFYRWMVVCKKNPGASCGVNAVPNLPIKVAPESLAAAADLDMSGFNARLMGGPWFYEDYDEGERIHHESGITFEEPINVIATRLYQNTDRIYRDKMLMQSSSVGRRPIYGGHIISLAHAMSFNGLENALRILAWNRCVHPNPCFPGDTLYAFTDVLEKQPIAGRSDAAALRLRLVAVKNQNPENEPLELKLPSGGGNGDYHSNVILDLDYYALVPMRGGSR